MIGRAALVAIACAIPIAARASAPASFDYLHVRAHEGNASGGHVAIRFGDAVFDFQNEAGLVVPRREDARHFQHLYRTLENRGIERSRVAASEETIDRLRDAFERRLLAQSRQVALAEALERDVALLASLDAGSPIEVSVRGAGFFAPVAPSERSPALADLRRAIEARHGSHWLAERDAASARRLRTIDLAPPAIDAIEIEPLALPGAAEPLSRRIAQALAARRAVAVIVAPHALRPEALAGDTGIALDAASRDSLAAWRSALVESGVRLAASRRPDWGEALLLAAARIAAIDASLASGRLVVLDAIPASAKRLPMTDRRRALVPALLAETNDELAAAREDWAAAAGRSDAAQAALEAAASRVAALRAARDGASDLRVARDAMLAEGFAPVPVDPRPVADPSDALAATRRASADLRARVGDRYGYDLVRRNCVTEIFRTVDLALAGEAEERLGGHVAATGGANFIPFVSSRSVRARWNVTEHAHLDSAREHATRDASFVAALRESNAFTSSFYEPADRAGFFVFFADAPWPLRPLFGALNLAGALVRSGVGVATLPFDRGAGLRSGLDGALWSVPELVFANVRKGTNDWVAPGSRAPAE